MDDSLHALLAGWVNFYLVTGTAAAALTGLQFVVQTLLASQPMQSLAGSDPESGIAAFGSPTVVHLALSLIVSAAMCAPWPGFRSLRVALVLFGGGALVYSALVLRRARQQRSYRPVLEDWIWHFLLPAVAYAAVMVAALFLHRGAEGPLFAVGTATLLLLCVAIHNAWDTITYFTINAVRGVPPQGDAAPAPENVASMSGPGDEP